MAAVAFDDGADEFVLDHLPRDDAPKIAGAGLVDVLNDEKEDIESLKTVQMLLGGDEIEVASSVTYSYQAVDEYLSHGNP